jgi:hypothetical protein
VSFNTYSSGMDSETCDALELVETVALLFALVGYLWAWLFIALGLSLGAVRLSLWVVEAILF